MTDNTKLFSGKSNYYAASRPSYPAEALEWLFRHCPGAEKVVDIGAGTGIFTALLQKIFPQVCAVEPNCDMQKEFIRALPDIELISGTGENSTLPDHSIDLITIAQAFHWLDENQFKAEAMRILKPAGKVAIIWNNRVAGGVGTARDTMSRRYCPRFSKGYAGKRSPAEGDHFLRYEYFKNVEYFTVPNYLVMMQEQFISNALSRSYAPDSNDAIYGEYLENLQNIFREYAQNGTVTEEYKTEIFLGSF